MRNEKLYDKLIKLHNIVLVIKYPEMCPEIVENVVGCVDTLREECANMVDHITDDELIDMVEKLYHSK